MTRDLTKGSPMKLILGFGIPVLLGNLFQQLYNVVDTAIVGKTLGGSALAAVGNTGSINFLVVGAAVRCREREGTAALCCRGRLADPAPGNPPDFEHGSVLQKYPDGYADA